LTASSPTASSPTSPSSTVCFTPLACRFPMKPPPESWIERYHQDSIESGARIRDGLSRAVEAPSAIWQWILKTSGKHSLARSRGRGSLAAADYYKNLLRLIYRLLFLMVIEERDLVFPAIYCREKRGGISIATITACSACACSPSTVTSPITAGTTCGCRCSPPSGSLKQMGRATSWASPRLPAISSATRPSRTWPDAPRAMTFFSAVLRALNVYEHPENHQLIRVNYAALNVEEFGSVYEGLLEYKPVISRTW
jgi:hypothetical protein